MHFVTGAIQYDMTKIKTAFLSLVNHGEHLTLTGHKRNSMFC